MNIPIIISVVGAIVGMFGLAFAIPHKEKCHGKVEREQVVGKLSFYSLSLEKWVIYR